jgi:hypothetical protein
VFGRFKNLFFSVANTDFEGGDDDHGHGDYIFLVNDAQPSHNDSGAHFSVLINTVQYRI